MFWLDSLSLTHTDTTPSRHIASFISMCLSNFVSTISTNQQQQKISSHSFWQMDRVQFVVYMLAFLWGGGITWLWQKKHFLKSSDFDSCIHMRLIKPYLSFTDFDFSFVCFSIKHPVVSLSALLSCLDFSSGIGHLNLSTGYCVRCAMIFFQ